MNIDLFGRQIDEISLNLYQNKEHDALEELNDFFVNLQELTDNLIQMDMEKEEKERTIQYIKIMYEELYDGYKNKDMLCMADCLQQDVTILSEFYRIKIGASK